MENNVSEPKKEKNKFKVIIVGAGIAGLSAAYHLFKNGLTDFLILEARKRIGGRIIHLQIGKEKIELGAKWIHGVLGNPIYELAMMNGLVDIMQVPKPHRMVASTENGKQVPFAILQETCEAYLCFLKRCEEYFISQYSPPEGIDSVGDHINLEISLYLDKITDPRERHLRQLIFDSLLKRETCISGCDTMSEIDLIELGSYTELQGGNITLPNGYSSILQPLTAAFPQEQLLVEHPVAKIRWKNTRQAKSENGNESDDSDQTVIEDDAASKNSSRESSCEKEMGCSVAVTCSNGKTFYASHVICTIPLGVLKENVHTLFEPSLPDYKIESVNRLLFGTVDKILLEYDRPFLNPGVSEILLLWEEDSEGEGMDLKDTWYKKIYSFSKLSETLLLGWVSGKEAEYMETLPNEVVSDVCTDILRKFLNDPFIPKPKSCVW